MRCRSSTIGGQRACSGGNVMETGRRTSFSVSGYVPATQVSLGDDKEFDERCTFVGIDVFRFCRDAVNDVLSRFLTGVKVVDVFEKPVERRG